MEAGYVLWVHNVFKMVKLRLNKKEIHCCHKTYIFGIQIVFL